MKHAQVWPQETLFLWFFTVIVAFLTGVGGTLAWYTASYEDRALPGVTVGGQSVAGMNKEQIAALVSERFSQTQLTVTVNDEVLSASLPETGVHVDATATAEAALTGSGSFLATTRSLFFYTPVPTTSTLNESEFKAFATKVDALAGAPPVQGGIALSDDASSLVAQPASAGKGVDTESLSAALKETSTELKDENIHLAPQDVTPDITTEDAESAAKKANELIAPTVEVVTPKETVVATAADKAQWIETTLENGTLEASISSSKVKEWVEGVAGSVNRDPINGVNNVDESGTHIALARPPKPGMKVTNADAVSEEILSALENSSPASVQLAYDEVPASYDSRTVPSGPERFAYQAGSDEKWVDVNLTDSTLTAYVGQEVVRGPIFINHGGPGNETIIGIHRVYLKVPTQDLGCTPEWSYCERGVPWISYWSGNFALHGAPWVKEFGLGSNESSHGCVNIPVSEAKWLYEWTEVGTTVVTHY